MSTTTAKKRKTDRRFKRLLDFDAEIKQVVSQSQQLSLLAEGDGCCQGIAVIGIDEVGRGCLAGPVVAAAVILPDIKTGSLLAKALKNLDDSKAKSADEREELAAVLKAAAVFAVGEASVEEIDSINILQASLLAMKRARHQLEAVSPAVLLVDGNKKIPGLPDQQMTVVKGDSKSASIAAASVLAKVYRDKLMCNLSQSYPQYLWHDNKGYGSEQHRKAIREHGFTPWHRMSFHVEL